MAKAIKWQIAFQTNDPASPTSYRIDIYAEGYTGNPIQLTPGPQPFVTEEDKNTDFFTPVRSQTGTIQVCTKLPSGGLLDINDLLPSDNIAHPVRLINLSNSNAIEWQGFMSCEAFSQAYTEIPEIFSFPVLSVLEAMKSVQADTERLSGMKTVATTIDAIQEIFINEAGVSYFTQYYVPSVACGRNIMSKYIDNTVLFKTKEYNNENSTIYIVDGLSLNDCLSRIATYMGWCVRENNISLYFMAANETSGYIRHYRQGQITPGGEVVYSWMTDLYDTAVVTDDIADMEWRGTAHKRNIAQGAKSVEVVAKLDKYDANLELPEMPLDNLVYGERETTGGDTLKSYVTKNNTFDNRLEFYYYLVHRISNDTTATDTGNIDDAYNDCALNPSCDLSSKYPSFVAQQSTPFEYTKYIGAFFAKIALNSSDFSQGLYIVATNKSNNDATGSVFKIGTVLQHTLDKGSLKLKIKAKTWCTAYGTCIIPLDGSGDFIIKYGSMYWNGTSWTSTRQYVSIQFENGEADISMPIRSYMTGFISIEVRGIVSGSYTSAPVTYPYYDLFVEQLSLTFEPDNIESESDRSENKYFRLLGTNFSDEVSVSTELASSLNNLPSPSLIMNSDTEPMTELSYGTESRRPEVDLLNRLATYYGAARQRLELIVAHPTAAPLPILRLNGINDSKVYLPLAESRDWKEEVCTLTCFETNE